MQNVTHEAEEFRVAEEYTLCVAEALNCGHALLCSLAFGLLGAEFVSVNRGWLPVHFAHDVSQ